MQSHIVIRNAKSSGFPIRHSEVLEGIPYGGDCLHCMGASRGVNCQHIKGSVVITRYECTN